MWILVPLFRVCLHFHFTTFRRGFGLNCGFTACWLRPKGANISHEIEARSDGLDQCFNDFIFIPVRSQVSSV